jgi:hypothetical protein
MVATGLGASNPSPGDEKRVRPEDVEDMNVSMLLSGDQYR